jgi:hypothetical protein
MENRTLKRTLWIFAGIFLLLSVVLLTPQPSQAQTSWYWIGGIGEWNDLNNWSDSYGNTGVPFPGDYAYVTQSGAQVGYNATNLDSYPLEYLQVDNYSGVLHSWGKDIKVNNIDVGYDSEGQFYQSNGTYTVNYNLNLGVNTGGSGYYFLDGGSLSVGGDTIVGNNGYGYFMQSDTVGDTSHTVTGNLVLGSQTNGYGEYYLSSQGYAVNLTVNGSTIVGNQGIGIFNQSGGTHIVLGWCDCGYGRYVQHERRNIECNPHQQQRHDQFLRRDAQQ